jgi:hypothetical protein
MSKPKPIYRTDGQWMAILYQCNLFDTMGEWLGWLDGHDIYTRDGEYVGYVSQDGRLLRQRIMPYRKRRRPPTQCPPFKAPETIPLPPMFAELSYSVIDVFEEQPEAFGLVSELRPDAGERSLPRLADTDPRLAVQRDLRQVEQELLEEMVYGMIYSYGLTAPPVPIEAMAAGLRPESASNTCAASPGERVRITEGLIERLGHTSWALQRGYCGPEGFTPNQIQYAARALLLPRHWLRDEPLHSQQPAALAGRYVVSEEIAMLRLHDLR